MKKKNLITVLGVLLFLIFSINSNGSNPPTKKVTRAKTSYSIAELKKNLEYDYAAASIRIIYDDRLDQLAKLMKDKDYAVALRGHADAIGTFKGNWVLSQKRADAVKAYLVSKGVSNSKIVSTAFGSTIPVASNKTSEGRQQNRRVEIKLNSPADDASSEK